MKNKKTIIILLLVLTIGIVGLTIAYFANTTGINNEFNTKPYGTTIVEEFISPDNWLPGDVTPKTIVATNTGEVDQAVRVKLTESWKTANNGTLNGWIHTDGTKSTHETENDIANDERVAIINFDNNSDWYLEDGYYYYKYKLAPNESTSSLIKSVTFNSKTKLDDTCENSTNGNTKTVTCNSSGDDYDNATYNLVFTVETVQYDKYQEAWNLNNTVTITNTSKPQGVNFAQHIMSKSNAASITNYTDGVTTETYAFNHEATEQTPALTDYRYIGASPNNYVEFNCDDNGENCETWRAIGVFYVDDGNNNWEWRVKLVRGSVLEEGMPWDSNNVNDWTNSTLKTTLNSTYLDSFSLSAKSMIDDAKYYLGAITRESGDSNYGSVEKIYEKERGNTVCGSCNNDLLKIAIISKLGLMYPSDMYMTYTNGVDNICYDNPGGCNSGTPTTSWLYNSINSENASLTDTWLLSTLAGHSINVLRITPSYLYDSIACFNKGIRPTLYLSSSVKTTSGDGSIDSPYKLSL